MEQYLRELDTNHEKKQNEISRAAAYPSGFRHAVTACRQWLSVHQDRTCEEEDESSLCANIGHDRDDSFAVAGSN
jgi:hypothetical protein